MNSKRIITICILTFIVVSVVFSFIPKNNIGNSTETISSETHDIIKDESITEADTEAESSTEITTTTIAEETTTYIEETTTIEETTFVQETTTTEETTTTQEATTTEQTTTIEETTAIELLDIKAYYIGAQKIAGQSVSAADIAVIGTYSDGNMRAIDGWISGDVGKMLIEGINNVIIYYADKVTTLSVNVAPILKSLAVQNKFAQDDLNHLIMLVYQEVGNSPSSHRKNFISIAFNHYDNRFGGVGRIDQIIYNYNKSGGQYLWLIPKMTCWAGVTPSIQTVINAGRYDEILADINDVFVNGKTVPSTYMFCVTGAQYQKWIAGGQMVAGRLIYDGVGWIG